MEIELRRLQTENALLTQKLEIMQQREAPQEPEELSVPIQVQPNFSELIELQEQLVSQQQVITQLKQRVIDQQKELDGLHKFKIMREQDEPIYAKLSLARREIRTLSDENNQLTVLNQELNRKLNMDVNQKQQVMTKSQIQQMREMNEALMK